LPKCKRSAVNAPSSTPNTRLDIQYAQKLGVNLQDLLD
jgi:hypothetical protein